VSDLFADRDDYEEHDDAKSERWARLDDDDQREQDERDAKAEHE
jgi:hypothetical protein